MIAEYRPNLDEESRLFEQIICTHNSKFKSSKTSINAKLIESIRKIDSRIHRSDVLALIATPESGRQVSTTVSATPLNSLNSHTFATPTTTTSSYAPQITTSVSRDSTHNGTPASINAAGTTCKSTTPLSSFNQTHTPTFISTLGSSTAVDPAFLHAVYINATIFQMYLAPHLVHDWGLQKYIQLSDLNTITTKFGTVEVTRVQTV